MMLAGAMPCCLADMDAVADELDSNDDDLLDNELGSADDEEDSDDESAPYVDVGDFVAPPQVAGPEVDDVDAGMAALEAGVAQGADVQGADPFVAVRAATISSLGYVACPIAPWDKLANAGRITSWKKHGAPEASRSASCRCYYHPKCKFAKLRRLVSDNDFMCWLFAADLSEAANADERGRQRDAHMRMGVQMAFRRMPLEPAQG